MYCTVHVPAHVLYELVLSLHAHNTQNQIKLGCLVKKKVIVVVHFVTLLLSGIVRIVDIVNITIIRLCTDNTVLY